MVFTRSGMWMAGFKGFVSVRCLLSGKGRRPPREPGVYIVYLQPLRRPSFIPVSTAGRYRNRNPTVSESILRRAWVRRAQVLYIGKAGGPGMSSTLDTRVSTYLRFGHGENAAHFGGRYIWQLEDSDRLRICWKPFVAPRPVEKSLIAEFKRKHHQRPFANLKG